MEGRSQWIKFLSHSLATRLEPETFRSFVEILHLKYPLQPYEISQIFLAPTETNNGSLDPRIPHYLQTLLDTHMVNVPSVLRWLAAYSSLGSQADSQNEEGRDAQDGHDGKDTALETRSKRWTNSYASDEVLLYKVAKYVVASGNSRSIHDDPVELLRESKRWMQLVISAGHGEHEILNLGRVAEMNPVVIAVGTLVVAVTDDPRVLQILGRVKEPGLSGVMENFIPLLLQMSPQNAARLDHFRSQTLVAIQPAEKKEKEVTASKEIDEMLGEVGGTIEMELENMVVASFPTVNTRAGLYIYLNALVSHRWTRC